MSSVRTRYPAREKLVRSRSLRRRHGADDWRRDRLSHHFVSSHHRRSAEVAADAALDESFDCHSTSVVLEIAFGVSLLPRGRCLQTVLEEAVGVPSTPPTAPPPVPAAGAPAPSPVPAA